MDNIFNEIKAVDNVSLQKKLLAVQKIEESRNDIEEGQYLKEYNELKLNYEVKFQEYHEQMSKIITGEDNGTVPSEDIEKYQIKEGENKENGIPEFWKNVLINSKFFEINEKDKEILTHLKNITLKLNEPSLDFTVNFHFEKNDFFEDEIIFKKYFYDHTTYETNKAESSEIKWQEGKNPAIKIKTKKIKKGKSVEVKKTETIVPSFFDNFPGKEESGEEIIAELVQQSEFIRDELIANSTEMYLDIHQDGGMDDPEESEEDEPIFSAKKNDKKRK